MKLNACLQTNDYAHGRSITVTVEVDPQQTVEEFVTEYLMPVASRVKNRDNFVSMRHLSHMDHLELRLIMKYDDKGEIVKYEHYELPEEVQKENELVGETKNSATPAEIEVWNAIIGNVLLAVSKNENITVPEIVEILSKRYSVTARNSL